jgi:hypothetical protein
MTVVDALGPVIDLDQPARIAAQPQPLVARQFRVQREICIRGRVTAEMDSACIEESLVVGPSEENMVFGRRGSAHKRIP